MVSGLGGTVTIVCIVNIYTPPARDVNPTVGLMPTMLLLLDGEIMLPAVSVPIVTVAKPMDAATPQPDDEPNGSAFG